MLADDTAAIFLSLGRDRGSRRQIRLTLLRVASRVATLLDPFSFTGPVNATYGGHMLVQRTVSFYGAEAAQKTPFQRFGRALRLHRDAGSNVRPPAEKGGQKFLLLPACFTLRIPPASLRPPDLRGYLVSTPSLAAIASIFFK
jgi:hypothetical protein